MWYNGRSGISVDDRRAVYPRCNCSSSYFCQHIVSISLTWFPSPPASYYGGTFLLTIEGTPRGNGNKDDKIEPADSNNKTHDNSGGVGYDDGDNYKNFKESDREERLLSLQVNSDNARTFTDDDDAISGEIFLGKNNIDMTNGNGFDIKFIFNDCQVVTYSKE